MLSRRLAQYRTRHQLSGPQQVLRLQLRRQSGGSTNRAELAELGQVRRLRHVERLQPRRPGVLCTSGSIRVSVRRTIAASETLMRRTRLSVANNAMNGDHSDLKKGQQPGHRQPRRRVLCRCLLLHRPRQHPAQRLPLLSAAVAEHQTLTAALLTPATQSTRCQAALAVIVTLQSQQRNTIEVKEHADPHALLGLVRGLRRQSDLQCWERVPQNSMRTAGSGADAAAGWGAPAGQSAPSSSGATAA